MSLLRSAIYHWFAPNPTFCPHFHVFVHSIMALLTPLSRRQQVAWKVGTFIPDYTAPHPRMYAPSDGNPCTDSCDVAYNRCSKGLLWEWWLNWWFSNTGMCTACFWVITCHFMEKSCCRRNIGISCCCITVGNTWLSWTGCSHPTRIPRHCSTPGYWQRIVSVMFHVKMYHFGFSSFRWSTSAAASIQVAEPMH